MRDLDFEISRIKEKRRLTKSKSKNLDFISFKKGGLSEFQDENEEIDESQTDFKHKENIRKFLVENYKHGKNYNFTTQFPKPIIFIFLKYLQNKDLTQLSLTCKFWFQRIKQWKSNFSNFIFR